MHWIKMKISDNLQQLSNEIKMYNRVLTKEEIVADMEDPMHNLSVSPIDKVATTWGLLKRANF